MGEQVLFGYLIYELTDSTAWVGISLAFYTGPMLLFGAPAGVVADRFDRRILLPLVEIAIIVTLGTLGILFLLGKFELWQLLLMIFILGIHRAVYEPIKSSYAYDIVGGKNIVSSLGLLNLAYRFGQLLGAFVAGTALHYLGPSSAFFILCVGHCCALLLLGRLTTLGKSVDAVVESVGDNLRDYWFEICNNKNLLVLIGITAAVEVLGFSFATALPELATLKFEAGANGLGYMHGARACGGVLAGIALAGTLNLDNKGRIYLIVVFCFGFSVIGLGLAPYLSLVLLAVGVVSIMATAIDVLSQSMMQLIVPDRLRGRAMGTWIFAIGIAPLGHLELGFLAEIVQADTALVINGVGLVCIGLIIIFFAPKIFKHQNLPPS